MKTPPPNLTQMQHISPINITSTLTGVIYPKDIVDVYGSDFLKNPQEVSDLYIIGNSNIMGIHLKGADSVSTLIEKHTNYTVNNFGLPYSDMLTFYNIIRSHVPNGSMCVLELNSCIITSFRNSSLFTDVDKETFTSIFIEILDLLNKKGIKCIFTNIEKNNLRDEYEDARPYINFFAPVAEYLNDDRYHLNPSGTTKYFTFIQNILNNGSYVNATDAYDKLVKLYPNYYEIFSKFMNNRKKLCYHIIKMSKDYNRFIEYLKTLKEKNKKYTNIGLLLGTFNPCTVGHINLIKYASSKVDLLYIGYIQNDVYCFSKEERLKMLMLSIEEFDNVCVIDSCGFIGTPILNSDYIFKDVRHLKELQFTYENKIDIELIDILNVNKRFFGDETNDPITERYMKIFTDDVSKTIKNNAFDIDIMPRYEIEGNAVSATQVREYYNTNILKLENLVSPKVFAYLQDIKQKRR